MKKRANEIFKFALKGLVIFAFLQLPMQAQEEGENLSPAEDAISTAGTKTTVHPKLWTNQESGQLYANSSVKFILDANDNLSKTDYIEYKIDDGEFIRYSAPITIAKEGPHNITYRSADRAGNREFDHSFNVVIDNTAPEVELTPAKPFVEKDGRLFTSPGNIFVIRAIDEHSGVKSIRYGVNSKAEASYEEGRTVQLSESGSQLIRYDALDYLGNRTIGGSVLVEVDGSRPVVSIQPTKPLRQIEEDQYARRSTGFTVNATDEGGAGISQVMVRIDASQEWQVYNNTLYFATEKEHTIDAKAIDAVGNESEIVSIRFKLDDNPPVTKIRTSVEENKDKN